ncbi:MAG: HEAT repeat domain-containing protein [Elusimicrobia bacterium]|nr:HEAT repeat domain-containing protein [Elusimicrobiota bacterium]
MRALLRGAVLGVLLAGGAAAAPRPTPTPAPAPTPGPAEPDAGRPGMGNRKFALAGLVRALTDKDEHVRAKAAEDLGKVRPPAVEAVPDLIQALRDPASVVRYRAAETLERIGTPAARKAVLAFRRKYRRNRWLW